MKETIFSKETAKSFIIMDSKNGHLSLLSAFLQQSANTLCKVNNATFTLLTRPITSLFWVCFQRLLAVLSSCCIFIANGRRSRCFIYHSLAAISLCRTFFFLNAAETVVCNAIQKKQSYCLRSHKVDYGINVWDVISNLFISFRSVVQVLSKALTYLKSGRDTPVNGKWFAVKSDLFECIGEASFYQIFHW